VSFGITRRAMLAGIPGCLLASVRGTNAVQPLPHASEFFRFLDPVTETPVVRLTNPTAHSYLPASTNPFVSVRDRFLLFSSDRNGALAPFRLDLRNGALTQIATTQKLRPESLSLSSRGNEAFLVDGDALVEIGLTNRRMRVLAEGVSSYCELGRTSDPEARFVIVREGRLEILSSRHGGSLAEEVDNFCLGRPGGRGCLFRKVTGTDEQQLWYVATTGQPGSEPVLLIEGNVANPVWTRAGHQLLFLREAFHNDVFVSEIHGINPESRSEAMVARTSQFAAFSPNADTSVFVGASRSKAQPTILLLLASPPRELTLCEHRASKPRDVSPVFSADSKRVYFQSDHEGKSALYSVNVEKLIEPTAAIN
jgi:oligogalacturonide lyase